MACVIYSNTFLDMEYNSDNPCGKSYARLVRFNRSSEVLMRKNKGRVRRAIIAIGPKVIEELIELLVKIVGETVKDKLARAVLITVIGSAGQYAASVIDEDGSAPDHPVVFATPIKENAP